MHAAQANRATRESWQSWLVHDLYGIFGWLAALPQLSKVLRELCFTCLSRIQVGSNKEIEDKKDWIQFGFRKQSLWSSKNARDLQHNIYTMECLWSNANPHPSSNMKNSSSKLSNRQRGLYITYVVMVYNAVHNKHIARCFLGENRSQTVFQSLNSMINSMNDHLLHLHCVCNSFQS